MRISNAFLFVLLGALLVGALNAASRALGPPEGEERIVRELAAAKGRPLVVVGASTAHGIVLDRSCQDAGAFRSASDIFEAEAAVEHLLAADEAPRTWILVAAPGMTRNDSGSRAGYGSDHRKAFYRAFYQDGYRGVIGSDWRNLAIGLSLPALGDRAWQPHVRLLASQFGLPSRDPSPAGLLPMDRQMTAPELDRKAVTNAEIRKVETDRIAYYDGDLGDRVAQAFGRIAGTIRRSGGRVVIVSPPVSDASLEVMQRRHGDWTEEFAAAIAEARSQGALYVDTMSVPGISDRPGLFADPEHLNRLGSIEYSDLLAAKLFGRGLVASSATRCDRIEMQDGVR